MAAEEVARIRAALIEQGDLPPPQKSAEQLEWDRIEVGLLTINPDPDHNEVIEFEGQRYRCKYRTLAGVWVRRWEPVTN